MGEGKEEVQWEEWRPPFANHVLGRYTVRTNDPETGMPNEQTYEIVCEHHGCALRWGPSKCSSGAVRQHIANFAINHLHRDPLDLPKKA